MKKLNELMARQKKLATTLEMKKQEAAFAQKQYALIQKEYNTLSNEINKLKKSELNVSEHALLRTAERVFGYDSDKVKKIITNAVSEIHKTIGDGEYPVSELGIIVVIKNNNVITVKN